jgi:hypothetical protein
MQDAPTTTLPRLAVVYLGPQEPDIVGLVEHLVQVAEQGSIKRFRKIQGHAEPLAFVEFQAPRSMREAPEVVPLSLIIQEYAYLALFAFVCFIIGIMYAKLTLVK